MGLYQDRFYLLFTTRGKSSGGDRERGSTMAWLGSEDRVQSPFTAQTPTTPDDPVPADWPGDLRRVLFDPNSGSGDRCLRTFIHTISSGRADLDVVVLPMRIIDQQDVPPDILEGELGNQLRSQGFAAAALVMLGQPPTGQGQRGGFWARFDMSEGVGVWAMELMHCLTGFDDLYPFGGNLGPYDNMAGSEGTHPTAYTKAAVQWLDPGAIAQHSSLAATYDLHTVGLVQPPPTGRWSAVRVGGQVPYLMVESRSRVDQFDVGIPAEGVIVYRVQTTDPLGHTQNNQAPAELLTVTPAGGPAALSAGAVLTTDNGVTVRVLSALAGGISVRIEDPSHHLADRSAEFHAPAAAPAGRLAHPGPWGPGHRLPGYVGLPARAVARRPRRNRYHGPDPERGRTAGRGQPVRIREYQPRPDDPAVPGRRGDRAQPVLDDGRRGHRQPQRHRGGADRRGRPGGLLPRRPRHPSRHLPPVQRTLPGTLVDRRRSRARRRRSDRERLAPPSAGAPSTFVDGSGVHIVVYRSGDGVIRDLYRTTGAVVGENLSGTAGTPDAAGDPVAYYTAHDDTHQVAYVGQDGHLWELYWAGTTPVVGWDLSLPSGAPPGTGTPAAYYSAGTNTKHVFYRSGDGQLHEIWWVPGGGVPGYVNLTAAYGLPPAADDPAALTIEGPNTQHVIFRGTDGDIYEVQW